MQTCVLVILLDLLLCRKLLQFHTTVRTSTDWLSTHSTCALLLNWVNLSGYPSVCLSLISLHPRLNSLTVWLIKAMSQWRDATRASNQHRQFVSAHVTFQTGSVSFSLAIWTMSYWCLSCPHTATLAHHSLTITMSLNRVRKCVILLMQLQHVCAQKHMHKHIFVRFGAVWDRERKMLICHATRVPDLPLFNLALA